MEHLILLGAVFIPALLAIAGLLAWRCVRKLDKRRSPLTVQWMNLPGESLRKRIATDEEKLYEATGTMVAVGPILLSAWLLARLSQAGIDWGQLRFGTGDMVFVLVLALMMTWLLWKLIRHARRRRQALDGLHAELSVAHCLTPLIAEGAMVFHDFPADRYNIDHIVVARSAVFAIETKSRRKPGEKGRASACVRYDGRQLIFPKHVETKPIEQADYQANWLDRFLRSAGAEGVRVIPVLALPGWYVERPERRTRVIVNNCTNANFMMSDRFGVPMSESLRKHVAHLLSERYPPPEL